MIEANSRTSGASPLSPQVPARQCRRLSHPCRQFRIVIPILVYIQPARFRILVRTRRLRVESTGYRVSSGARRSATFSKSPSSNVRSTKPCW